MADLIDRDAVLGALCYNCTSGVIKPCPITGRCPVYNLIKKFPTMNRWTSVDDALPDAFIYVICAGKDGMGILRYNGEVWVDDSGCIYPISAITHWMPLHELPEKG